MNDKEKSHWDSKYEEGLPSLREPDPFFISAYERFVEPAFPSAGMALDLAVSGDTPCGWQAETGGFVGWTFPKWRVES